MDMDTTKKCVKTSLVYFFFQYPHSQIDRVRRAAKKLDRSTHTNGKWSCHMLSISHHITLMMPLSQCSKWLILCLHLQMFLLHNILHKALLHSQCQYIWILHRCIRKRQTKKQVSIGFQTYPTLFYQKKSFSLLHLNYLEGSIKEPPCKGKLTHFFGIFFLETFG